MTRNPGIVEPENGTELVSGEQHDRHRRSPVLTHLPFALVIAVTVLGLVRIWEYYWRQGAVLIGGAMLIAAVLRMLLSTEQAGLLALRSRPVDVLLYGGFGVVVVGVAMTITGGLLG